MKRVYFIVDKLIIQSCGQLAKDGTKRQTAHIQIGLQELSLSNVNDARDSFLWGNCS